jgi:hypothetical protein
MKLIVDGPKFSGKSTLVRYFGEVFPASSRFEIRCYFDSLDCLDPRTNYYVPLANTVTPLEAFTEFLTTIPSSHDVIIERFHLFDWVQLATSHQNTRWERYERIESRLLALGFKLLIMLPPLRCLTDRAIHARRQHIPIPLDILKRHHELFARAMALTELPFFLMSKCYPNRAAISDWISNK